MKLEQPKTFGIAPAAAFSIAFLIFGGSAFGQAHVTLVLERSADLIEWDEVSITDELLTEEGLIELSAEGVAGFFRIRIGGGDEDSSFGVRLKFGSRAVEVGRQVELELERTFDLNNWHRLAVTPELRNLIPGGPIREPSVLPEAVRGTSNPISAGRLTTAGANPKQGDVLGVSGLPGPSRRMD